MNASTTDESGSVSWQLEEFTLGKDCSSTNPTRVYVDRATHEFGIIYFDSNSAAAMEVYPDTDEPVYFAAKAAHAACWHSKSNKISMLFEHAQIDLRFHSPAEARNFLDAFEDATAATHNISFCTYEHHSNAKFKERSFNMRREDVAGRVVQPWMDAHMPSSEWPSLRESGDWADFSIKAGDRTFAVHRVKLCKESEYFRAICNGGFTEASDRRVKLPESDRIIDILLDEMYDTYNSTHTTRRLDLCSPALHCDRRRRKSACSTICSICLSLRISLEKIKTKIAKTLIDRMPFIHDVLAIVDLATCIFDEQCPQVDRGLRKAIVSQLHDRMPSIIKDEAAWAEYATSKAVIKAFHAYVFDTAAPVESHVATQTTQCASPPTSPTGVKRRRVS